MKIHNLHDDLQMNSKFLKDKNFLETLNEESCFLKIKRNSFPIHKKQSKEIKPFD